MKTIPLFLAVLALAAGLTLAALVRGVPEAQAFFGLGDTHETLALTEGAVRINTSDLTPGQARFYTVTVDGTEVSFFLLPGPDGVIRAAFDACDVCFAAKKGYRQDGPDMICQNCGLRFESRMVGRIKGGCNPSPLAFDLADGQVVITGETMGQGRPLFAGTPR